jgi:hypothetical protein
MIDFFKTIFNIKKIYRITGYIYLDRFNNPVDFETNRNTILKTIEIKESNEKKALESAKSIFKSNYPQINTKIYFKLIK